MRVCVRQKEREREPPFVDPTTRGREKLVSPLRVSKGARLALCALIIPVSDSLVGRSDSARRSALASVNSNREGRAKPYLGAPVRVVIAQKASTRRIRQRVGCQITRIERRLPRRARSQCWRGTQGHKESSARTKSVVRTQSMYRAWPQLRQHILLLPRSPARHLPAVSTSGRGARAKTAAAAASASTSDGGATAKIVERSRARQ